MNYIGIDGNIYSDSLMHWKYIKKIKSGSGWRYFYTPEEIRAFYKEEQREANAEYKREVDSLKNKQWYGVDKKKRKEQLKKNPNDNRIPLRKLNKEENKKWNNELIRRARREKAVDPMVNTAKKAASKPIDEAKKDVKDVKDYYKWQEQKANKRYKKEQKEIKEITKGAQEWNKVYSQEGGYGDNSRAKGKAISAAITAGSKGAKTISSIRRSATPKINTGKAIVNRTLKKELNAERKRREAARKRKTANRVVSKTTNISKNISKALSTGVKKNETRKNRSGNKSYKMYNRW